MIGDHLVARPLTIFSAASKNILQTVMDTDPMNKPLVASIRSHKYNDSRCSSQVDNAYLNV